MGTWWQPRGVLSWQWQLSGTLDLSQPVAVYDIDGELATAAQVATLKARGIKTIAYFDTSFEPGRSDSNALKPFTCGPYQGWPGQRWLDFRQPAVRSAMVWRMRRYATKGFDAVEADSVDAITNNPRCAPKLTAQDQLDFIKFLADECHRLGMAFGLKNNPDQAAALHSSFDFIVIEEAVKYDELDVYARAAQGKSMFLCEYVGGTGSRFLASAKRKSRTVFAQARAHGASPIIKRLDLDATVYRP